MPVLNVIDLGHCDYDTALNLQQKLLEHAKGSRGPDGSMILVEHDPPVVTRGRRGGEQFLLASPEKLAAMGIDFRDTSRGGEVTYHGPGQLVGYPIFDLTCTGRSVHDHIRRIERALIAALGRHDIAAGTVEGLTGVWVGDAKIAAIGIAVTRWVTYHGFALNVNTDLSHFDLIVPCGIADRGVTSMANLLDRPIEMAQVRRDVVECFQSVFGFDTARDIPPARAEKQ
ncbi:MAG: lipoyl(octanoyl) transferase LipB [Phycisphaerae bacterium]